MASGKTTLGRALAKELGYTFIDLDFYIEQRYRKRIPHLFEEYGEEAFRELESRMLREAGEFCDTVISCGGGTPCFGDNMEYMMERGITVWLDASTDRICQRIRISATRRPLLDGKSDEELHDFISAHLNQRLPHYMRAHLRIPSDSLESRSQIASTIANLLTLLPPNSSPQ